MERKRTEINILLIEDDEVSNYIATHVLNDAGFEKINIVENGLIGLKFIQEHCPDVIFLDLNMPVMDGFEFLKNTQEKNICQQTPIAILSSSTRSTDMEKALSYNNVISYLEKPLDEKKINSFLNKLTEVNCRANLNT